LAALARGLALTTFLGSYSLLLLIFGFMNHEVLDDRELYLIDNFFINSINDW